MKIQIKLLEFNPFRSKETLIDQEILQSLKDSIKQVGFIGSLDARPHPKDKGKYQISCGHNRLTALQELGFKEVEVTVRDLDDFIMVRSMANENKDDYDNNPTIILNTIRDTRNFLRDELAKYNSWKDLNNFIQILFETEHSFIQTKTHGIGWSVILRFLNTDLLPGYGWKQSKIQKALSDLDDKEVSEEALKVFEKEHIGTSFKTAIKKENKKRREKKQKNLTKDEVLAVAKKVNERISTTVNGKKKKIGSGTGNSTQVAIDTMVSQELNTDDKYETALNDIIVEINLIEKETERLSNAIGTLNGRLDDLGITEIKSLSITITISKFSNLLNNINTLSNLLGIQFNSLIQLENEKTILQLNER